MDERLLSPHGTELLCENITNTKFEDLSGDNVKLFKDRVLDMVGCILGGAIVKENEFLEKRYYEWGGAPEAPVFASERKRLPLPNAVLLNALKARSNDFGSMLFKIHGDAMPSHMGETLLPLGLTLAETFKTSGKELITNVVASEDVMGRLLFTLPVRFPVDMLLVASAAAAVAGRFYGFDAKQLKEAFGYSVTNATDPGNSYFDYSAEFRFHNGASAQMGVMAAELVKGGWTGLEDPFYGQSGLISSRVKDGNYPEFYEKIFEDLGQVYYTECAFKRNPGGIPMTAVGMAAEHVSEMIAEKYGKVDASQIASITVYTANKVYSEYYGNPFVKRNQVNALFAYRFAAAAAMINHGIRVEQVQTDYINAEENKDLLRLAEEAKMESYDSVGTPAMKVKALMKDGTEFVAEESFFAMEKPMSKEFLENKFRAQFNAYGKLPAVNADKIIELAGKLDELEDLREFTELFS